MQEYCSNFSISNRKFDSALQNIPQFGTEIFLSNSRIFVCLQFLNIKILDTKSITFLEVTTSNFKTKNLNYSQRELQKLSLKVFQQTEH